MSTRRWDRSPSLSSFPLALTLHIDPIFVGAHHLSRFVFVTIATPGIVHLFGRPQEDVDD
jgi:uncharacterized membrane protein AbrB (regulator of aidB expression)